MFESNARASEALDKIRQVQTEAEASQLLRYFHGGAIIEDSVLTFLDKNSSGEYFLKGYTMPIPKELVQRMADYSDKGLPVDSLINFWMLCMDNPDERARMDLFKFADQYNFPITPYGYFVGYKSVYRLKDARNVIDEDDRERIFRASVLGTGKRFNEIVDTEIGRNMLLAGWNLVQLCLKDEEDDLMRDPVFLFVPTQVNDIDWEDYVFEEVKKVDSELFAELQAADDFSVQDIYSTKDAVDAYVNIDGADDSDETFTDIHTRTFSIKLGEPVKMERHLCDSNPDRTCSSGLHIGAPGYVKDFGYGNKAIIACLVNPAHVVAVPIDYSFMKMRVCEYFPYAISEFDKAENLTEIDTQFYEADYLGYEKEELQKRLAQWERKELSFENQQVASVIRERLLIIE